jgi:hypothetical protein
MIQPDRNALQQFRSKDRTAITNPLVPLLLSELAATTPRSDASFQSKHQHQTSYPDTAQTEASCSLIVVFVAF